MEAKVGIYVRLSDEDRFKKNKNDDSESIANQKSMLLKYALNKNWEVINVYSDDDYSGADINRPQFQQLIRDCEAGLINIVLCKTQSRFSRDIEVIERYIHNKFIEWGVRFISIVDNADTNDENNKKSRQINGLINEWYLEDLSKNIKKSLQNKREDGLFVGSFAPYGYIKDPNNKNKLLIDPIASEVVKKIFDLFKSGIGYYNIAKYLNNNEILTPSRYKKENGSKFHCENINCNTKWSQYTISKILRNEVYIGNMIQGKKTYVSYKNHKSISVPKSKWIIVEKTHEPIIDIETWEYVQQKFKSRTRVSKNIGEVYILSKKVYCKECNQIFTRQLYKTKEGKTPYLKCKGRKLANHNCINKESIRCDILEKIVLDELNDQLKRYYNLNELERIYKLRNISFKKDFQNEKEKIEQEKNDIEKKITKKKEYYKQLYIDKLEEIITEKDFIIFKEKFSKEIDNYEKRLKLLNQNLENTKTKEEKICKTKDIFEKYKHIKKLNREIIDEFIDKIWIGKVDSNERDIVIEMNIIKLN